MSGFVFKMGFMVQIKNSFHSGMKKKTADKGEKNFATETGGVLDGGKVCPILTGDWRTNTPLVNKEKCVGCGICVESCPEASMEVVEKRGQKKVEIDLDFCKGCGICSQVCPFGAIEMKK